MFVTNLLEDFLKLSLLKTREFIFLTEKVLNIKFNNIKTVLVEKKEEPTIEKKIEEKFEFELYLMEKITDQSTKIKAIKTVRDIVGVELRVAKELIDKAPVTIKKNLTKIEAEELLKKCEASGAKFEIR